MARYIEANDLVRKMTLQANRSSLGEIAPPSLSYSEMLEIIADVPTADVDKIKIDVAREIFEEIEFDIHQLLFDRDEHRAIAIEGVIAELKKKYTEGE